MKKNKMIFSIIILMFGLTGCSGNKPDSVVKTFCNAMQEFDIETMKECVLNESGKIDESIDEENELGSSLMDYYKENAKKIDYTIEDSQIDGDTGTVTVKFTYLDTEPVVTITLAEYMQKGIALAFSGAEISDSTGSAMFTEIFDEKKNSVKTEMIEEEIQLSCVKGEEGWKIKDLSDEVLNVMMSNALTAFESFSDSFNDTSGESDAVIADGNSTEESEEEVIINVPIGEQAELATIKLKVTSVSESEELISEYSNVVAQEGTKYVIYQVEVENITKEPFTFNASDIPMIDSQGRSFSLYTDAFLYVDDSICYEELAPNIVQSGSMIYNVPLDASDYCIKTGKAGTNEVYVFWAK
ncbi:MAG: DUF4352 domain-containing protein [Candidatus Pacebacteria bacterium]|nr:DUF4352 domain-containing protein [Candidatus Paceibacterota bacterium]